MVVAKGGVGTKGDKTRGKYAEGFSGDVRDGRGFSSWC